MVQTAGLRTITICPGCGDALIKDYQRMLCLTCGHYFGPETPKKVAPRQEVKTPRVVREKLSQRAKKDGDAPNHKWTEVEDEYVRTHYKGNGKSVFEIAQFLRLKPGQIKSHIQFLGLSNHTGHARWDPKDDELLRELAGKLSCSRIGKRLTPIRTATAVSLRLRRLNISRRVRDDWYTKTEAAEIFGVDHHRIQYFIDTGYLGASYHHDTKPCKGGMAMWHIDRDAMASFLQRHADELNGRNVDLIQIVQILTRSTNGQLSTM